jgi:branched-chain amino acid transport system substrate-binding protein
VTNFLDGMKEAGVTPNVVGEQYPPLGTTDFSSYISAIIAAKPDFVFLGLSGGDLLTFIRQAKGYGLFQQTRAGALNATDVLETLKADAPAGMYLWARAPFFAMQDYPKVQDLVARYREKVGTWPPEWPILAYSAVEAWADAVKRAGTFEPTKVAEALVDTPLETIRGPLTLRACDHQANSKTFIGTVSDKVNETYGFPILDNVQVIDGDGVQMPCELAQSLQRK